MQIKRLDVDDNPLLERSLILSKEESEERLAYYNNVLLPFDFDNPVCHKNLSSCRPTPYKNHFECSCGFEVWPVFVPIEIKSIKTKEVECSKCGKLFSVKYSSIVKYCIPCGKKVSKIKQRERRRREKEAKSQ